MWITYLYPLNWFDSIRFDLISIWVDLYFYFRYISDSIWTSILHDSFLCRFFSAQLYFGVDFSFDSNSIWFWINFLFPIWVDLDFHFNTSWFNFLKYLIHFDFRLAIFSMLDFDVDFYFVSTRIYFSVDVYFDFYSIWCYFEFLSVFLFDLISNFFSLFDSFRFQIDFFLWHFNLISILIPNSIRSDFHSI